MNQPSASFFNFPSVDIVEASAGSGKTFCLAQRYIALLFDPALPTDSNPLKSILAITFTNKAAGEMKARIIEFLKRCALDDFPSPVVKHELYRLIPLPEPQARERAGVLLSQIIHHYNDFHVQTIDSFIHTVLTRCALHLEKASSCAIRDDFDTYLMYALDVFIDRLDNDKDVQAVFKRFLEHYLFIEHKTNWFSKKDILGTLRALCGSLHTYGGTFSLPPAGAGEISALKKRLITQFFEIRRILPEGAHKQLVTALEALSHEDYQRLSVEGLSKYFLRKDFPVRKGADVPPEVASLWRQIRETIRHWCECEAVATFRPYMEMIVMVMSFVHEAAEKDEVMFLQELNTLAQALISAPTLSVGEVYYRLATRLRHYLIDEFQDTSMLQWLTMRFFIEEALSSGGSFFYVGDKKQAIYRFRGGDITLFDEVRDSLKLFEPTTTTLTRNYRSLAAIVQANNTVFAPTNLERFAREVFATLELSTTHYDTKPLLEVFADSRQEPQEHAQGGYCCIEHIPGGTVDEKEAFMHHKALDLITKLRRRYALSDIALLARDNSDVELFTSWCLEAGIPAASERTLSIRKHPLINELRAFLTFLNAPVDDIAFAAFINGDIFQKASDMTTCQISEFIFNARREKRDSETNYLYRAFRHAYPAVWQEYIDPLFKSVGFIPLYELVISIFQHFKVIEHFPEYQAFFMKFLDVIKSQENEYVGIDSFGEHFQAMPERECFISPGETDAVTIITIHKAKGLEFKTVIIPFCEMDIAMGSGGVGRRMPYVVKKNSDGSLSLRYLKKIYARYSPQVAEEFIAEYTASLIDELNTLYVAFTRAACELYVFIPPKSSGKRNIARVVMPGEVATFGTPPKATGTSSARIPARPISPSRYKNWVNVLKEEFMPHEALANRVQRLQGVISHFMLSRIGNLTDRDPQVAIEAAYQAACARFPNSDMLNRCRVIVDQVIQTKGLRQFFYCDEAEVMTECEIITRQGLTRRIDRLVVGDTFVWIIDYKSSTDEAGLHDEQLKEYRDLMTEIYPEKNIACFLLYLDTAQSQQVI